MDRPGPVRLTEPAPATTTAIVGGRVVPVAGAPVEDGVVLVRGGRIEAVGRDVRIPDDAGRVDATGKVVLPGLVDAHVHLGVHEEAVGWAGQDTNELTDPVTPHLRALDAPSTRPTSASPTRSPAGS
jgi:imidazolonepropionase-like amidohydrolase